MPHVDPFHNVDDVLGDILRMISDTLNRLHHQNRIKRLGHLTGRGDHRLRQLRNQLIAQIID